VCGKETTMVEEAHTLSKFLAEGIFHPYCVVVIFCWARRMLQTTTKLALTMSWEVNAYGNNRLRRVAGLLGAVEGDMCNRGLQEAQQQFYAQAINYMKP